MDNNTPRHAVDAAIEEVNKAGRVGFMIGQRVIYQNVICTICAPEISGSSFHAWVFNPERGYRHGVDVNNLNPLPNGQL